ncbi:DTW domain-containing protein 1-like [Lingula anatina]|uniref:tRNA-uridine aminocarboxypropyltransferase 1 n=1 Tax=Lingula anatina TaxID=7574 RepID=A0A1S3HZJ5_LINAN|nr:DTW domain-containing protein 1-like [Lingula anatina]|eukprot:XP_013390514.1 DTW domain-containing protein 1-like [Lingula anatina]
MEENPYPYLKISDFSCLESVDTRSLCPKCNKSRKYYCYTCFCPVEGLQESVPKVKLPLKIDIIKHRSEIDGKSTSAHAATLAPDQVSVYTYPCIPDFPDKSRVVLVFPGEDSVTLEQLAKQCRVLRKQQVASLPGFSVTDAEKRNKGDMKSENSEISKYQVKGQDSCDVGQNEGPKVKGHQEQTVSELEAVNEHNESSTEKDISEICKFRDDDGEPPVKQRRISSDKITSNDKSMQHNTKQSVSQQTQCVESQLPQSDQPDLAEASENNTTPQAMTHPTESSDSQLTHSNQAQTRSDEKIDSSDQCQADQSLKRQSVPHKTVGNKNAAVKDLSQLTQSEESHLTQADSATPTVEERNIYEAPFDRVVFIDCTWNQTKSIFCDERLKGLRCIELKKHKTKFWRHQRNKPDTYLATVEAIYYFLREYHDLFVDAEYNGQYDNMLFFFAFMYQKIKNLFDGGKNLKAYQKPNN